MKAKRYDSERLGLLLRLLRPAPRAWVAKAKRIPLGAPSAAEIAQLARRLEDNPGFRRSFDADPVAATGSVGLETLTAQLEQELAELLAQPDEWLDRVPEVAAHTQEELPPETRLRLLLLSSRSVASKLASARRR
jgi:hypothetical protein